MAMSGSVLGAAIKTAIDNLSDADKTNRDKLFEAMGVAIVAHIIANAEVAVASVTLVTAGLAASGPGTGTISA